MQWQNIMVMIMKITVEKDAEFTTMIADLIAQLCKTDDYIIKIWTLNPELTFNIDCEMHDIHFMTEGMKVIDKDGISYILFDTINNIIVVTGEEKLRWERIK